MNIANQVLLDANSRALMTKATQAKVFGTNRIAKRGIGMTCFMLLLIIATGFYALGAHAAEIPNSEVNYPGASATKAFVAMEPYIINIQGVSTTIPLWGAPRAHDFSGNVPFINPSTGAADPSQLQAWDPVFAASFNPPLQGTYNLNGKNITNAGFPGRIEKRRSEDGVDFTMIRYNAGDGITEGKARSQLNAYPVPPRTRVRWEIEVAFGAADGENDWVLTPSATWSRGSINNGGSPVLFWQMKNESQTNPAMSAIVDTDIDDPAKLMITFYQRTGIDTKPSIIGQVKGISRYSLTRIVIDAFLDERKAEDGGKGIVQISVNGALVVQKAGPTLALGTTSHNWSPGMYLFGEAGPYQYTRTSFWKTARMIVFPVDITAPSAPASLSASVISLQTNLSWSASTDNVAVTGYNIYRNGAEIGTSTETSFSTFSNLVEGVFYNYTVRAYDAAGNLSASSNTATVTKKK